MHRKSKILNLEQQLPLGREGWEWDQREEHRGFNLYCSIFQEKKKIWSMYGKVSRLGKVGWLVCSSLHWSFFSGLKLFSSIFCMLEIFGNFKGGMCREITAKKVWSQHWPVACAGPSELTESWHVWSHSLLTQAWQALDLSTGEGTEAWRDEVTSARPHTGGRSPLTVSCVSGETGKGRRMSGRGLPPCKNQSSSNCWPFLFLLSIKEPQKI